MIEYAVIVPIYNEEKSVVLLCEEIAEVMNKIALGHYEIIFVDDGSTDNSLSNLKQIVPKIKDLIILSLDKNYGQSLAIQAGFDISSGQIIITLDGDLQNDPKDIPRLLNKMGQGYDVVSGWRKGKYSKWHKSCASRIANFIQRVLFKEKIHDVGCMLRVYTRNALNSINLDGCKHRFLTAILAKKGFKISEVEISSKPRLFGVSKYGIIDRAIKSLFEILCIYFFKNNKSISYKRRYNIKEIIR